MKNFQNIKILAVILFSIFYFLFSLSPALAQPTFLDDVRKDIGTPPITKLSDAEDVILDIVEWIIGIFWVLAVGFVVWAAFLYLTAGGNEEKITEAKKRLVHALIAAAIALLATGIDFIVFRLIAGTSYY